MKRKELFELTASLAVPDSEEEITEAALEIMKKYTPNAEIKNGNVLAHFGERSDKKPHVLIDAHSDIVGLIVTSVMEDGFVKADCMGGLDRRIFPAQRVVIHGSGKKLHGVICTIPPHLRSDNAVIAKDMIYIDSLCGPETARELISPGDRIFFDSPCVPLQGDRICGRGFDDRCGMAAVIKAVEGLEGNYSGLPFSFTVMFSSQEEIGERGACIGAYDIDPDISVAVDVSFALSEGENRTKCGEMGKGCMIGISPSLSRRLSDSFIRLAKKHGIPYQREVMNGITSTNADRFSVNRGGSEAVTLSIPLRYMHTPREIADMADIEYTAELITHFLKEGTGNE